ncbi:non-canonical purine NTP pyrophosphatase [Candidatus Gracilibacteria bacterium]|nr:non-canonical purine NTP pyrophosphatase [Candidatus Gracilibacteria bacterium]
MHSPSITFITGNPKKAEYLEKYLGFPVLHKKLDLDELQSLDLKEVVEHKVRQAYAKIGTPVLVEDVALEFVALGRLPGTFIKFFITEIPYESICRLLDNRDRRAIARCGYGYYDGVHFEYFSGMMSGTISDHPGKENGFGWDRIFIPKGYTTIRSELSEEEYKKVYLQIKPLEKVREYFEQLQMEE